MAALRLVSNVLLAALVATMLAGCSGNPSPDHATTPLYHPDMDRYQFGPPADEPDTDVVTGLCTAQGHVMAYTFNVANASQDGMVRLTRAQGANDTVSSFAFLAFLPSDEELGLAQSVVGGHFTGARPGIPWQGTPPDAWTVPHDSQGVVRLVVACRGNGVLSYAVGQPDTTAPRYLPAAEATSFEVFFASGTVSQDPLTGPVAYTLHQSHAGSMRLFHEKDPIDGFARGTTHINWTRPESGWTNVSCGHLGSAEHGRWSYRASLHAVERRHEALLLQYYDPGPAYPVGPMQRDLLGAPAVWHADEGNGTGELRFTVELDTTSPHLWRASCQGIHLGSTLNDLLGTPAASIWQVAAGLQP